MSSSNQIKSERLQQGVTIVVVRRLVACLVKYTGDTTLDDVQDELEDLIATATGAVPEDVYVCEVSSGDVQITILLHERESDYAQLREAVVELSLLVQQQITFFNVLRLEVSWRTGIVHPVPAPSL